MTKKVKKPNRPAGQVDRVVLRVGSQIRFAGEAEPYTIRAASKRYGVCTRAMTDADREDFEYEGDDSPPIYTIIDWDQMKRGEHNLVLNPFDFETDDGCRECIESLEAGECELSGRRNKTIPLVLSE